MSASPTSLSGDLSRLAREGYALEVREGYLLVHDIPYVDCDKQVLRGTLVSTLTLAGNVTQPPDTHVMMFIGKQPCEADGQVLSAISHAGAQALTPTLSVDFSFSSKPVGASGYSDYYEKVTTYAAIVSAPAQHLDPDASPRTYRVVPPYESDSVFRYEDTASSRAGLGVINAKLAAGAVAIIGLGGTGGYLLDLLVKTPIREIHLFDGDRFLQHNAFRAPGGPGIEDLVGAPFKVEYYLGRYSPMRTGIVAHTEYVDAENVDELAPMTCVFICVDSSPARRPITERLTSLGVLFIDVGMSVDVVEGAHALVGQLRVTAATKSKHDHLDRHVPMGESRTEDVYATSIQVADLNCLNAALAVVRFKKLLGYYFDTEHEYHSIYQVDGNTVVNAEQQP